jgi:hypothetical protein
VGSLFVSWNRTRVFANEVKNALRSLTFAAACERWSMGFAACAGIQENVSGVTHTNQTSVERVYYRRVYPFLCGGADIIAPKLPFAHFFVALVEAHGEVMVARLP